MSYFTTMVVVFLIVLFFSERRARHYGFPIRWVIDLVGLSAFSGFVGGRMAHVIIERPYYYLSHWSDIFKVWNGGFVYFGGLFLGGLTFYLFLKIKKLPVFVWLDFFSPMAALSYSLGRIGCFFAGCCYGRPSDVPWSVKIPHLDDMSRHPTQLYATFWEFFVFLALLRMESKIMRHEQILDSQPNDEQTIPKKRKDFSGVIFFTWLTLHGVGRLIMEAFRDDFRGPTLEGFSVSTWISLGLVMTGFSGGFIRVMRCWHGGCFGAIRWFVFPRK